jgi:hypothetical protein
MSASIPKRQHFIAQMQLQRFADENGNTYLRRIRPRAQSELDWFAHQPSLHAAIRTAALAVNSRGKRYFHQRRLTKLALERALSLGLRAAATLDMSELPREFRALKPHEIEDALCIFKYKFGSSRRTLVPADAARRSWCG